MSAIGEFVPEELDIFSNRPYLFCISDSVIHEYTPLNTLENTNSLEFNSLAYNDKYKDMSWVFLKLQLKLVKGDSSDYASTVPDDEQPHLVTNALHR